MTTTPQAALLSDALEKMGDFFRAHEAWQLCRIDDGRIQLHLTDDQYEAVRLAVADKLKPRSSTLTNDELIDLAVEHGLGRTLPPLGLNTGNVFYTDNSYRTAALFDFADAHEAAILAKLQATQEPVQAGELPALPHDGWPARFRCDSCDGNGEIGELISMGHFQPPERQTCPDCGGRGWSDEGPAFNADHMRDYARAVLSARKPLTVPDSMSHKAFFQAGAICHEMGYVSVAGVQRKLAIGWNEAKAICQHLHDTGSLAGLEMSPHINGIGLEVKP